MKGHSWHFPAVTHPPNHYPYTWSREILVELKKLVGKSVLLSGVDFRAWKVEFEVVVVKVEIDKKHALALADGQMPYLENIFALQDLETGEVYRCNEMMK